MTTDRHHPARHRRRTRLVAAFAVVLVCVGGLSTASAATLDVSASASDNVAGGSANIVACDSDLAPVIGGYVFEGSEFVATKVVVSDVAKACGKSVASVVVVDAQNVVVASGIATVPVGGGDVTVPIRLTNPTAAHAVRVVIS